MPSMRGTELLWDAAVVGDTNSGGSKATGTLVSTGTDNDIYIVSKVVGDAGNDIVVHLVGDTAVSVVVGTHDIAVHINTGTTDANAVITAIQGNGAANALVTVALTPDSSGAGKVTAAATVTLAGGKNEVSSRGAGIGPMWNVAVFVDVSGACEFKLQASASKVLSSGRNAIDNVEWFDYIRAEALEVKVGVLTGLATITFGGAGAIAIDCSPFAPTFLRLVRTDNNGNDVTITAYTVAVG